MNSSKKILQIILDIVILAIVASWAYMLYHDYAALPSGEQAIYLLFNIKVLLFALFLIAAVTSMFYFNILEKTEARNDLEDRLIHSASSGENYREILNEVRDLKKAFNSRKDVPQTTISSNKKEDLQSEGSEKILSILNARSFSDISDLIFNRIHEKTGAKRISLMLFDNENKNLLIIKKLGFPLNDTRLNEISEGISWLSFQSQKRFYVTNIESHPEIGRKNKPEYLKKSFMTFPIVILDHLSIGVLSVSEKESENGIFSKDDLESVQSITRIMEVKMENLIMGNSIQHLIQSR